MKGFMIYETPLWGNEENTVYLQEVKDASYTLKQVGSDDITCCLEGIATKDPVTKATCNKEDTYDFETGALIALMKMCGVDKVVRACNEAFSEDTFKTYALKYEEEIKKLKKENEKLQHEYDLCLNSENALKYSVDYLNKSIAKLNTAIYRYKDDLYKATKRCEELELKEDILNKQEETINKREEEMSVYFGGRGNGKQYEALVELFKKMDQKKVDEAYKEAYNTALPLWQKEALKQMFDIHKETKERSVWPTSPSFTRDYLDSLLESSKYAIPYTTEWIKPPTKRGEMWEEMFAIHKHSDVVIKVKREDVNTFLHEIENKIPEITWASGVKIFESKYAIKDVYFLNKTYDIIYFRLSKENKLSYTSDPDIYQYRELKHIDYLPPMRWDLFKKGRIYVKLDAKYFDEFKQACKRELGVSPNTGYFNGEMIVINIPKEERFVTTRDLKGFKARKIINWEDVRDKATTMEDPYDTWKW